MSERSLRLGTRGSPLAVRQAEWVAAQLRARMPRLVVELVRITTTGDRVLDRSLGEIGGKGLFVKEIEEALLAGRIDAAVHSMKDLPAVLAPRLAIAAIPAREDPRDVLVSAAPGGLGGLRSGARVATGSLRRSAFLRHARPDLEVVPIRGNVDTRLGKWRAGAADALVLARAGLRRLGLDVREAQTLEPEEMLPAIGQGALAIETHDTGDWRRMLATLNDTRTAVAVTAERAVLRALGGDCMTPIAAHGRVHDGRVRLAAIVADVEGRRVVRGDCEGPAPEADALGLALGRDLLARGAEEILAELRK